jgi:isoquinoline 1-oxidoreductase alpha subunit
VITLTLNGQQHALDLDPNTPLLWALRDHFQLTGTKFGCGAALCGACTVHMNGTPTRACVTTLASAANADIRTIEGLDSTAGKAVQQAWRNLDVVQCGYCQSGQLMSAAALLDSNKRPTDDDIDQAMNGNICRCATYQRIRAAIHQAAATLAEDVS